MCGWDFQWLMPVRVPSELRTILTLVEGAFESRKGIPCSSLGACDHRIVAVAPIPITLPGLSLDSCRSQSTSVAAVAVCCSRQTGQDTDRTERFKIKRRKILSNWKMTCPTGQGTTPFRNDTAPMSLAYECLCVCSSARLNALPLVPRS